MHCYVDNETLAIRCVTLRIRGNVSYLFTNGLVFAVDVFRLESSKRIRWLNMIASTRPSPEDEFYANLTLGLVKFLNTIPRITNITLNKQQPSERTQITTWEQRHNVYLADDMRRFYLSTDGFTLHWSYQYSRNPLILPLYRIPGREEKKNP